MADAFSRPAKMKESKSQFHKRWLAQYCYHQITTSKSVMAVNLNASTLNRFLNANPLSVIPPPDLKDLQYQDEQVMKLKKIYHQELTKEEKMLQTPDVNKLL